MTYFKYHLLLKVHKNTPKKLVYFANYTIRQKDYTICQTIMGAIKKEIIN